MQQQPSTNQWRAQGSALLDIGLGLEMSEVDQRQIGPYRLMEKLGEGGLGIVWRAEQTDPIRREVAVKLIRSEMHYSAEVISRFEMERQALARMSHPNIASILDAGTMPDERPYFVMELVPGVPLTTFCKVHDLSRKDRLQLMINLCHAVHHAHQKGILHRDLKPSNILVHEQDGQPVPKIIDFGIAKALDATDSHLSDPFFQTQIGEVPAATYPYMSPEQASCGLQSLDTRSDIYTLGVILYELLTGKLPLPDEMLRAGRFDQVAAHIMDVDAKPPSTTVPDLRGELDWIILRALERDPERRYESAAAFGDDLRKHLQNEPVSAGPPTTLYRFQKWSRRHRVAFLSGSLIAASLCIGLISATAALMRERAALQREAAERQRADTNLTLAVEREREAQSARTTAVKAKQQAETERNSAIESRQTADVARSTAERLLNDILFGLRDELEPMGRLALLEPISSSAETYFRSVPPTTDNDDQQRNRAVMFQSRGSLHLAQGNAAAAKESFNESLNILQQRSSAQPKNAQRLHDLALGLERLGTADEALGDLTKAQAKYVEMLPLFDQLKELSSGLPELWQIDAALPYERLGDLARFKGDIKQAMSYFIQGRDLLADLHGPNKTSKSRLAVLEEKLGVTEESLGNKEAATQHYETALKLVGAFQNDLRAEASAAILHGRLAQLSSPEKAVSHSDFQTQTFAKLTAIDPLNLTWQKQYVTALQQQGSVFESTRQPLEAILCYRKALTTLGPVPEINKKPLTSARERVATHLRLAAALFKTKSDKEAKEQAKLSLRCMSGIDTSPEMRQWKRTAEALLNAP